MTVSNYPFDETIKQENPAVTTRSFRNANTLEKWLYEEAEYWQHIETKIQNYKPISIDPGLSEYKVRIDNALQVLNDFKNQYENEHNRNIQTSNLTNRMSGISNENHIISYSQEGKLLKDLADKTPSAAWLWIANKKGHAINLSQISNLDLFLEGWLTINGKLKKLSPAINSFKESSNELFKDWEKEIEEQRTRIEDLCKEEKAWSLKRKKSLEEYVKQNDEIKKNHEAKMKEMEEQYSEKMKLQASELMWKNKETENRETAASNLKQFFWILSLGTAALAVFYYLIFQKYSPTELGFTGSIIFSMPIIAFFWLVKIFSTNYRQNTLLADDARERQAMVLAFKALEFEDKVSEKERVIILNALFRHYGNTHEEQLPAGVLELLNRSKPNQ